MSRLVFLLEEYSMAVLFEGLLPRIYPDLPFLCISHEGKQDLEKSIPRKLRAWQEPGVRFVIVRDKDEGDCRRVKARLYSLCQTGRREDSLIRIACHELEAWYLGDTELSRMPLKKSRSGAVGAQRKPRCSAVSFR